MYYTLIIFQAPASSTSGEDQTTGAQATPVTAEGEAAHPEVMLETD